MLATVRPRRVRDVARQSNQTPDVFHKQPTIKTNKSFHTHTQHTQTNPMHYRGTSVGRSLGRSVARSDWLAGCDGECAQHFRPVVQVARRRARRPRNAAHVFNAINTTPSLMAIYYSAPSIRFLDARCLPPLFIDASVCERTQNARESSVTCVSRRPRGSRIEPKRNADFSSSFRFAQSGCRSQCWRSLVCARRRTVVARAQRRRLDSVFPKRVVARSFQRVTFFCELCVVCVCVCVCVWCVLRRRRVRVAAADRRTDSRRSRASSRRSISTIGRSDASRCC